MKARGKFALTLTLSPGRGNRTGTPDEPPRGLCEDLGVGRSKSNAPTSWPRWMPFPPLLGERAGVRAGQVHFFAYFCPSASGV
jgi:hypothetical protein